MLSKLARIILIIFDLLAGTVVLLYMGLEINSKGLPYLFESGYSIYLFLGILFLIMFYGNGIYIILR